MAEGNDDNISPDNSRICKNHQSVDDSDDEESMQPDLGIENVRELNKKSQYIDNHLSASSGTSDTPKREENPFSFKHFLKRDSNSYQCQGARPKVYTASHSSVLDVSNVSGSGCQSTDNHQPRIGPEFSSALPDFVQDHLVIEQCYLGADASPQELIDIDNLPDFTPGQSRNGSNRWNERRNTNTPSNLPLDLPTRPRVGFPLDLPLTESQANCTRSCPQSAEVGVSKSLPDFLSDGAVYSQPEDSSTVGQSPERETDRLRRELELVRRQLAEQTRRSDQLQRHLDASRQKEHDYTHNLNKAIKHIEENLNVSNTRAITAENTVAKLKQDIKQLTAEVYQLQKENESLRGVEESSGAVGGAVRGSVRHNEQRESVRFARELRLAASSAEHSLRQLLSGVDNLRMMADTVETLYRIEEPFTPDEDAGPNL